jgi:molybdenum cofactor cytidylyltransferase
MGFPKPLLRIGGETFLAQTAASMLTVVERLVIVLGAHREAVIAVVPPDPRIVTTENADYLSGQLSSIKAGLRAVSLHATAAVVHLVDHPAVLPDTFRAVIRQYEASGMPIVIARHQGRRGHPVLFDRAVFSELQAAPLEFGARVVVNASPDRVTYAEVGDAGVLLDLDTPEDLARADLPPRPTS